MQFPRRGGAINPQGVDGTAVWARESQMWPCAIKVWLRAAELTQPSPENRRKYFGEVFHTPLRLYTLSVLWEIWIHLAGLPVWKRKRKRRRRKGGGKRKRKRKKYETKNPSHFAYIFLNLHMTCSLNNFPASSFTDFFPFSHVYISTLLFVWIYACTYSERWSALSSDSKIIHRVLWSIYSQLGLL